VEATEELGELVRSFNRMAEDLEEERALAETSTDPAVSREPGHWKSAAANWKHCCGRTIPIAVSVSRSTRTCGVLQAKIGACAQAASARAINHDLSGMPLESILPSEIADELIVLFAA